MSFICLYLFHLVLLIRFPDVYTQFRIALEKQGIRVRRLINIPDTFKPLPDGIVIKPIPNLLDYGYLSMKFIFVFQSLTFLFRCEFRFE